MMKIYDRNDDEYVISMCVIWFLWLWCVIWMYNFSLITFSWKLLIEHSFNLLSLFLINVYNVGQ